MKRIIGETVYNAGIYLRLSDDDGDKQESNSIKNQREFIMEFLKSMPEIRIHAERKDDGFSGVDFFSSRDSGGLEGCAFWHRQLCGCKRPFPIGQKLH